MKNPTDIDLLSAETAPWSYGEVKQRIQGILPSPIEFKDDQNLIEVGLDSLKIMRLANSWRRDGAKVTFAEMISSPCLKDWLRLLQSGKRKPSDPEKSAEEPQTVENATGPFPLTDVQHAYWIGRRGDQPLGGVGCHAYLEVDGKGIEPQRLEQAWQQIVMHHPMLRARFRQDGLQEIMERPASMAVPVHDLRRLSEDEQSKELERIRDRLSHRLLQVENGAVTGLELSLLCGNRTRLHLDIDLLVADVQSLRIILQDLAAAYGRGALPAAPSSWSFANYLEKEARLRLSDRQNAAQYWRKRLPTMPEAPALPLQKAPRTVSFPVFKRREHRVRADRWKLLKERSTCHGITPAMTLLTAYAEVLDRWSADSRFLINIPLFNRQTDQPGIEDAVADFTSLLLLAVDCSSPRPFLERAREIQAQFHKDAANAAYSGVQVQRDMARARGREGMFAPVVFASNLGAPLINEEGRRTLGKLTYMISQTPQVWLDFQSYETEEGLLLAWDGVEELFPEGLLDQMFSAYVRLMDWLAEESNDWLSGPDVLPALRERRRKADAASLPSVPDRCLHAPFFDLAARNPLRTALIDTRTDTAFSYGELAKYALRIAAFLKENGVGEGDPVAVTLPRGTEQVAAVLGIEAAGACYVPVSIEQPADRRNRIHEQAGIRCVLCDGEKLRAADPPKDALVLDITDALRTPPLAEPVATSPSGPAYIIFTSGSTGQPKGVEISHAAAWNTIADINRRYDVGPGDRALAVSALDFDLSVYDVFGMLGAGGSLVLVTEETRRDAAHWLALLNRHRVTIWNSVPVLLDMLLIAAESASSPPLPLRLAMLSGDWIGLDIPRRLKKAAEHCRFIAMGGATEASIWSNYCEVTLPLPEHWVSIPYGRPLSNQEYRVVDAKGRDCPDWVPGELWIGGAGVALGYRGDPELTAERFVSWEGTRWYHTGDLGRFWPDGTLEFLGRKDYQLKIRGHRIEPGEIEAAIKKHPGVRDAVVTVEGDPRGNKRLVAYVVPDGEKDSSLFETENVDPARAETLRTALLAAGTEEAGEKIPEEMEPEDFPLFQEYADNLVVTHICRALKNAGAFLEPGEKLSPESLINQCGIHPRYRELMQQWLEALADEGLLIKEETGEYGISLALPTEPSEALSRRRTYPEWLNHTRSLAEYVRGIDEFDILLLRGRVDPLEVFFSHDPGLSPDELVQRLPGASLRNGIARNLVKTFVEAPGSPETLRVLEIGGRNAPFTRSLLSLLPADKTVYTCADNSPFFLNAAKNRLEDYPFVQYRLLDMDKNPLDQGWDSHGFHVVIASNSLHRAKDAETSLAHIRSLLAPGGWLLLLEMTRNSHLQKITAGFLEEGFIRFEDERAASRLPLLSADTWREILRKQGYDEVAEFPEKSRADHVFGQQVIMARAPGAVKRFQPEELSGFLRRKLPDYMVPPVIIPLEKLPLSPNGKVDRRALPSPGGERRAKPTNKAGAPRTPVERSLADAWKRILEIDEIGVTDNFFELGGDSLLATKLCAAVRTEFKVELSLGSIFAGPTVAEQAKHVQELMESSNETSAADLPRIVPAPEERNMPFPLTDIQQAYWVGRSGAYALGNVATHCYFEIEGDDLDLERVSRAWQRLIDHHEMMRAVILPDGGGQQILDKVPLYRIRTRDLRAMSREETAAELSATREEMSHQVLSTDQWPLFDVRATRFGKNRTRIHVSFDNLIFDGWSMIHLLNEWSRLYRAPDASLPALDLSFRDYVLALEKLRGSERYERDRDYWFQRLPDLPPAPELPLAQNPDTLESQRFSRMEFTLHRDKWRRLKKRAARHNLTPSGILLAAFAEVLGAWSKSPRFTINLTLFNRLPLHPQVNRIIGDFTSLTLLAADLSAGNTFFQRAENLQQQLWRDLDHPHIGGVRVLRELGRRNNDRKGAVMPVVFTSALGVEHTHDGLSGMDLLGDLVYNITQTPQVWLDHQVLEQRGDLVLVWDSVQGLFPEGVLAAMFEAYRRLVTSLAEGAEVWREDRFSLIPGSQLEKRAEINRTEEPLPPETLHTLFSSRASAQGEKCAVLSSSRTLSYRQLSNRSAQLGFLLREMGARPDTLIAVIMEKGWEQVVAVLGILRSGAAYVPIDPSLPEERRFHLLRDGGVRIALTQSWLKESLQWPEEVETLSVDAMEEHDEKLSPPDPARNPGNLAYVIYTSGSTGVPKGVMIDHRGAVNTILDVNRRFHVGPEDKVLALSSLSFDLSVYDIFGTLAAGGTIVMPDADKTRDPAHWLELMNREGVTLWNSVPALMRMLVEYACGRKESLPASLRLALLSGDWIPLDLPDKIRRLAADTLVVSLGGATEASIWSIFHPIQEVDPSWKSIPYGRPIANQRFHVMNDFMEDRPDWVPGRLFIAGTGLARGYWKDRVKTECSFITHPKTGERLYSTGDLGRYLPDGAIEFLGRDDFQVKIRGHRIELGEIEAALKQHPGVREAVVATIGDDRGNKRLAGYVVLDQEQAVTVRDELNSFLKRKLPDYMAPSSISVLDKIPLTPNGKIDRQALPVPEEAATEREKIFISPRTQTEVSLAHIWAEVLNASRISIYDNFFELGGDSLLAVQVVSRVRQTLQVELSLRELFEAPNIAELSEVIEKELKDEAIRTLLPEIAPDLENRHQPFPLTDIQQAYWIGRSEDFELGNVATHLYFEIESKHLNLERLNWAWQRVVDRHEMLRAVILPDGRQKVLEQTPPYQFEIRDLRNQNQEMLTAELEAIRREMSHQVLPAEKWPLFDIRASRLKDGWIRLHVSWDALIADAWSFFSFTSDWYEFYRNPETEVTPLDISFRDYVLAEADLQDSELYRRAQEYWSKRLPDLPPAPELPLAREPASIKQPRFNRRGFRLPAQAWQNLKDRATRNNLTPSGLLIAAYADVLSIWSKNPRFTINLTLFNRLPLHPQVNNIVGDFTSTILLGVESSEKEGFAARASRLQRQFWQDLDHRYFSGVQVLRELARLRGDFKKSVMPVVFTSALNMEALGCDVSGVSKLGEMVYSISQTPQVWLDHQVYEQDGELVLTWDAVEELFPEGLLDDMFAAYCGFLQRLAGEEDAWRKTARHLVPAAQLEKRAGVNATEAPLSPEMLHTLFHNQVSHRQDHPAVISSNRTLSYEELFTCSNHIGHLLREKGAEPNSLVAVVMEKGWEQVVAVLGILNSGAAYLPLDSELPGERIRHLLADGKVDLVLTQSWLDEKLEWPDGIRRFFVDKAASAKEDGTPLKPAQGPDDLAYVIYTSGSTGFPKGVMISHRGAVNTILDVNKRFDLGPEDRVLAISNLNFDLSVYDIFGTLAAGGTIVFPDPDKAREPAHWLDLTTDHRITVWSSVPALMRMFEEYLSGGTDAAPLSLRLILLSGDWIPLDLPDKIKSYCNGVRVIGLGGATEASIWSNLYPIEKINPDWKSIPYGYPMLNQRFHVFNESMEDCPDWVPGQLYIGGIGLAKGYWRDEEKTKSSFIVCPRTGERVYRTGDFGRYLPDGSIEFLGREDFQIKINGYRIELGEIETTLKRLPGVKDAVVTVTEGTGKENQLAGYVVPNHEKESVLFESKHVDSAWCASRWDSVRSVGLKEASQIPGSIDIASVPSFINSVEHLSFVIICRILHDMGIFSREGEGYSIDELMRRFEIQPRYRTLLLHWLEVLVEERILEKSEAGSYQNRHSLHKEMLQFPPNLSKDLTELYSSFQNSISICTDLLKGNSDPVELLLSENTFLTAEKLDSIAPGREYYLNLAGRLFSTITDSFSSDRNLRVLEVGTRAGNLTGDLLSLLPKDRGSYVYTDESSVFTDKIRMKWGSFSSLEYGLLNVNKSPGEQGYEPFSFDVIIADKTLHRAKHLEMTLKYVKELLAPGGLLFVTEPTQNNRLMLISVGFFEDGFAHLEDERNANHLPFIPVEKWRDLLEKTGFSKIMTFPEDGHAAGAFGQHVIVAQAPETVSVFKSSNIADALRRKLPDYMVPVRYMLLDKLPLTANMKVDRKALEKLGKKPEQISRTTYVAPFTGIQIRIASVWREMLGHTRIGIHDNFFELGGDSLRAIQCINLLKEAYRVNFSLREFFEEANVERLAKKIEEKLEREKNVVMEEGEI